MRKGSKQFTTFNTLCLVTFFFLPPISVPTHYRILSVPLPCLILIFPLVGFISFLSPLTLNSPTLRLHTNHSSFNTPLRLEGTILWKTSSVLYNGQQSIHPCIKQFIIGKMIIRLYLITWRIVWSCNLRLQFSVSWRPLQAQLADKSIHDGTVFSMAHSKCYTSRGGAQESDRSNLSAVELLIK